MVGEEWTKEKWAMNIMIALLILIFLVVIFPFCLAWALADYLWGLMR